MKVKIYTDGSSDMKFTKEELDLHINILGHIRFKDIKNVMAQLRWLALLEMAKHGNAGTTKH